MVVKGPAQPTHSSAENYKTALPPLKNKETSRCFTKISIQWVSKGTVSRLRARDFFRARHPMNTILVKSPSPTRDKDAATPKMGGERRTPSCPALGNSTKRVWVYNFFTREVNMSGARDDQGEGQTRTSSDLAPWLFQ